jgi:hypothetical protein
MYTCEIPWSEREQVIRSVGLLKPWTFVLELCEMNAINNLIMFWKQSTKFESGKFKKVVRNPPRHTMLCAPDWGILGYHVLAELINGHISTIQLKHFHALLRRNKAWKCFNCWDVGGDFYRWQVQQIHDVQFDVYVVESNWTQKDRDIHLRENLKNICWISKNPTANAAGRVWDTIKERVGSHW